MPPSSQRLYYYEAGQNPPVSTRTTGRRPLRLCPRGHHVRHDRDHPGEDRVLTCRPGGSGERGTSRGDEAGGLVFEQLDTDEARSLPARRAAPQRFRRRLGRGYVFFSVDGQIW